MRSRNNVNDLRMATEREIAFVDFPVQRLIADNLVIMLHEPAYPLVCIFSETFDNDGTCGQPTDITVVTNRIVGTHGTVRKSLTIKTGLLSFCFCTLFLHRFPTILRRRRSDGLRSTVEIILVTGMVLSIFHTLFTDSLLALASIKVLVADF